MVVGGWLAKAEARAEAESDFETEVGFAAEADWEAEVDFEAEAVLEAEAGFDAEAGFEAAPVPVAFSCADAAAATPDDIAEKTIPTASVSVPRRNARPDRNTHDENTRHGPRDAPTPRRSCDAKVRRSNTGWPGRSG
jgi:hypothetical protein